MGVVTFTVVERECAVTPARLFKAMWFDNHNFYTLAMPHYIKSFELLKGDLDSIGCVKQFNFAEGTPHKYFKSENLDFDVEKNYIKYKTFEGDVLGDNIDYIVYEAKIEATGQFKMIGHFHPKGDVELATDDEVKCNLGGLVKALNAAEQYLINHPELYA
ncbi:pathogenesis-related protein STH-21-like [Silene latifolia]|uniref:pathogenesis-related protein STH-21-like n=1 Tax=Silene latifolia TaxID=37657 RepID=UPI003D782ABF